MTDVETETEAVRDLATGRFHRKGEVLATPAEVEAEAEALARDVLDLVGRSIADLGGDDEVSNATRALLVGFARQLTVAAFYDRKADRAGLGTKRGDAFATRALQHRAAGERSFARALVAHKLLAEHSKTKPGRALELLRAKVKGIAT